MNRTSWIFVAITAFLCLILIIFIYRPVISDNYNLYKENNKFQNELNQISQKREILTKLSKTNDLEALKKTAESFIPEESKSGELVIELTAMANSSNLKVTQISLQEAQAAAKKSDEDSEKTESKPAAKSVQTVSFGLKVSGNFANFLDFLKKTETASRLMTVTSVVFSKQQDGLGADIKGMAYFKNGSNIPESLVNINLSEQILDKFQNLTSYGNPINLPAEAGFGKTDPFN